MQPPGYSGPGQDPNSGTPPPDPFGQPGYGQVPPYSDPYGQPQQPPAQYPEYQVQPPADPTSGQPASGQPQYGQPQYGQPQYGQPQYGQPQYGQPQYGQPQYGQPQYGAPQYPAYPNTGYSVPPMLPGAPVGPSNTLGLLSMIFGIASIPLAVCCGIVGFGLGVAAIVTGILGMRKVSQGLATNRGMTLAGLICGGVGLVVFVAWIAIYAGSGVLNWPHVG